jgi:molybdopterin converting factor small subunit
MTLGERADPEADAMIHLKFLGHIKTSMGAEELEVSQGSISVSELFSLLLSSEAPVLDHGFSKYNTLLVVNDKEVFSASAQQDRLLSDGDSVLLVPFSHGG